ncbi:UNVERIFIED_CONTAM: hypothetical protein PYX00_011531 [Menopon gallinae]|uniref:MADS-box domain-containing protein n=1 Tax=Menopon gallinae TaxID=328185 RepID=A0AAW2H7W6_9NEOP
MAGRSRKQTGPDRALAATGYECVHSECECRTKTPASRCARACGAQLHGRGHGGARVCPDEATHKTPRSSSLPEDSGSGDRPCFADEHKDSGSCGGKRGTLVYIEQARRRGAAFGKRRRGIMKKAHELSLLTGAQVFVVVAGEP